MINDENQIYWNLLLYVDGTFKVHLGSGNRVLKAANKTPKCFIWMYAACCLYWSLAIYQKNLDLCSLISRIYWEINTQDR